jgi:hypothetical protein
VSSEAQEPIDKTGWGDGPWQNEADHVEFRHLGFPCIVHRVESHGGLCGYVAVPPGHPWHGVDFERDSREDGPTVHGGVTYADRCTGPVCHVPAPGEPDDVWWIGFDCAHAGDISPALNKHHDMRWGVLAIGEEYRTVEYVRAECTRLAEQASAAADRAVGLSCRNAETNGGEDVAT